LGEDDIERKFVRFVAPVVQGDARELFRRSFGVLEQGESSTGLVEFLSDMASRSLA
jgi:hypothetical protein